MKTPQPRLVSFALVAGLFAIALYVVWFGDKQQDSQHLTFDRQLQVNQQESNQNKPLVVVVPHHDLVKDTRVRFIENMSRQSQPETIILLSPNHFFSGANDVITTKRNWQVVNGTQTLAANINVIEGLVKNGLASVDDRAFDQEHGIKNLLGEIKEYFPNSFLVPVIFKETAEPASINKLEQFLIAECSKCGVIASVDMSHYQPAQVAEIHDIKTLRSLSRLDDDDAWTAEVDSNAALVFLIEWAKAKNLTRFTLFDHTNSGLLVDNPDAETTSHIFGSYGTGQLAPVVESMTFTFAGDAMLGREIGFRFQRNFQDLFSNLGNRTFWGTDISWLNLEGPISDIVIEQDRRPDNLIFNFSKQAIEALKFLKVTTVGLGNNHTGNQGRSGLRTTQQALDQAGIAWHGDPDQVVLESVKRYDQDRVRVSLVDVNALDSTAGLEDLIRKEKDDQRLVIVLPHWGQEYQPIHSTTQESLAGRWFKAGADLIIGSHPHVIQDAQIIDGKLVLYSLGNFVFDQYFSKVTQQGLIVVGFVDATTIKMVLVPTESNNLKPKILRGEDKKSIIDKICQTIKDYCHNGVIEFKRSGLTFL